MTQWKYFPDTTPPRDCFFATRGTQSDGHDFIPFGSFHRLPIFWDGRLDAFGREDVTARYAPWEDEE